MLDDRLYRRIDLFLLLVGGWFVLSLVVASLALMAVDTALGLTALVTVVLVGVVGTLSYLRTTGADPDIRFEVR
ncbi:hypothetical protein [Haloglomus litoreum]|uniref:hypothetical protein n=1 Tax=Haloglomus litoreum TaxID=3034026 RepID=UPI0023E8D358|nr:hypothetical protein [Haloglomus sp. DT116]